MRLELSDALRQTSSLFTQVLVEGSAKETKFSAMTADKTVIFTSRLKQPLPDMVGTSALANLNMLNGLLNFPAYNSETSTFTVKPWPDKPGIEQFEFRDKKASAVYRLMNPALIKEEDRPPTVSNIPWECSFEPQRAKLDEFSKLAGLYSEVDKLFTPRTIDGDLHFIIGDEGSSNHRATIVFQEDIGATIKGDIKYSIQGFSSIIKIAGANPYKLHLTSRGVMMVSVETAYGDYNYILRATR